MKKIALIITAILICFSVYAQEVELRKTYYDNGKLESIGNVISQKKRLKTGNWKFYYQSGQLKANGTYDIDQKIGLWIEHHENGQLKSSGEYQAITLMSLQMKKKGVWKHYYSNGQLKSIGEYTRKIGGNFKDKIWKYYFKNGQLKEKSTFLANSWETLNDGDWEEHYENGGIKIEGKYKRGKKNGVWKSFLNNGDLYIEVSWKHGVIHGKLKYFKNSILFEEFSYLNGKSNGIYKKYFNNGKTQITGTYRNGEKCCVWKEFNLEGDNIIDIDYDTKETETPSGIKNMSISKIKNDLKGHRIYKFNFDGFSEVKKVNILSKTQEYSGYWIVKVVFNLLDKIEQKEYYLKANLHYKRNTSGEWKYKKGEKLVYRIIEK